MRTNHIIRKFLFSAILCISSFSPVNAITQYAIDDVSCNQGQYRGKYEPFLDRQMSRVTTLAKFMSLNLGNNDRQAPGRNPEQWQVDSYINDLVILLMGDTQEA